MPSPSQGSWVSPGCAGSGGKRHPPPNPRGHGFQSEIAALGFPTAGNAGGQQPPAGRSEPQGCEARAGHGAAPQPRQRPRPRPRPRPRRSPQGRRALLPGGAGSAGSPQGKAASSAAPGPPSAQPASWITPVRGREGGRGRPGAGGGSREMAVPGVRRSPGPAV